jgi:hypothetical protein
MSPSLGSDGLRPRRRTRDEHETRSRLDPDAALGLTDEGRRVLAALLALDLLPARPPERAEQPGSHER